MKFSLCRRQLHLSAGTNCANNVVDSENKANNESEGNDGVERIVGRTAGNFNHYK